MSNPIRLKILIVDDQTDILDTLRLIVNPAIWDIRIAQSTLEAARMISENPFDFVITDFHMPDGTGDQVRRIAQAKGCTNVFLHTSDVSSFTTQFNRCFEKFDRSLLRFLKTGAFEVVNVL